MGFNPLPLCSHLLFPVYVRLIFVKQNPCIFLERMLTLEVDVVVPKGYVVFPYSLFLIFVFDDFFVVSFMSVSNIFHLNVKKNYFRKTSGG